MPPAEPSSTSSESSSLIIHEGQRVRCRGRLWEVREAPTVEGGQILTLSAVGGGDWPDLTVLHPIEQIEVFEQKEPPWHIGSARGFEILHDEILKLKVIDPAMGSGAFLVAATHYSAEEYGRRWS